MKKIPVKGFVHHASDKDGNHSHKLYITSWDGRVVDHVHGFGGVTSVDIGHRHEYVALTAPSPTGVPHVHAYNTITSFDEGHTHVITGVTGPAIDLPGGGHVHHFEGYTTVNGITPHTHLYRGTTGNEVFQ